MIFKEQLYSFHDEWDISVPLDEAWKAVSDSSSWQQWWPGLKSVVITDHQANIIGSKVNLIWRSKTGYKLRHAVTIKSVKPGLSIGFISVGDLQGSGTWKFIVNGSQTHMIIDWHVHTTKRWMNVLATVLRPIFIANHTALMKRGEAGLNEFLQKA